jgi:hypothetical protein
LIPGKKIFIDPVAFVPTKTSVHSVNHFAGRSADERSSLSAAKQAWLLQEGAHHGCQDAASSSSCHEAERRIRRETQNERAAT